jgi:hypothetical protein
MKMGKFESFLIEILRLTGDQGSGGKVSDNLWQGVNDGLWQVPEGTGRCGTNHWSYII